MAILTAWPLGSVDDRTPSNHRPRLPFRSSTLGEWQFGGYLDGIATGLWGVIECSAVSRDPFTGNCPCTSQKLQWLYAVNIQCVQFTASVSVNNFLVW
jgi:hypothetical protein